MREKGIFPNIIDKFREVNLFPKYSQRHDQLHAEDMAWWDIFHNPCYHSSGLELCDHLSNRYLNLFRLTGDFRSLERAEVWDLRAQKLEKEIIAGLSGKPRGN